MVSSLLHGSFSAELYQDIILTQFRHRNLDDTVLLGLCVEQSPHSLGDVGHGGKCEGEKNKVKQSQILRAGSYAGRLNSHGKRGRAAGRLIPSNASEVYSFTASFTLTVRWVQIGRCHMSVPTIVASNWSDLLRFCNPELPFEASRCWDLRCQMKPLRENPALQRSISVSHLR